MRVLLEERDALSDCSRRGAGRIWTEALVLIAEISCFGEEGGARQRLLRWMCGTQLNALGMVI